MRYATHNGIFHADDVMAAAIFRRINPDAIFTRTRDPEVLEIADIVFDVGAVYNHSRARYDHHQEGRAGTRENGIHYSSAGLVWKHFGHQICPQDIWEIVDQRIMMPLDAVDNGQELFRGEPAFDKVMGFGLSFPSVVDLFNPSWTENSDNESYDIAFEEAVEVAGQVLDRALVKAAGTVMAKELTRMALAERQDKRVLVLNRFHPWQEETIQDPDVLFCVFPSEIGEWMVQCVPTELGSFEKRMPLPEDWAGLRGKDLDVKTGIERCIFCHPARFIMGHMDRDGALKMVQKVLG